MAGTIHGLADVSDGQNVRSDLRWKKQNRMASLVQPLGEESKLFDVIQVARGIRRGPIAPVKKRDRIGSHNDPCGVCEGRSQWGQLQAVHQVWKYSVLALDSPAFHQAARD